MKIKAYPKNVCDVCGIKANRITCLKKYGVEPVRIKFDSSTYHIDICDICGEKTAVTEPRDFFYPDFTLKMPSWRQALNITQQK